MPDEDKENIEGPDFVIVDRRKREPEEEAEPKAEKPPHAPPPEQEEAPPSEQAQAEPEAPKGEEAEIADVYGTIAFAVSLLHQQAWHLIGLVPHPVSKEYKKDFDQAQVAIDTVSFLVGKLEGQIPDDEMRHLRALVSDLQLNFAKQKTSPDS